MLRENILFFIETNKIYIYLLNKKKEYIIKTDTSSFFKCGEISNCDKLQINVEKIFREKNIDTYILKPNIQVLYNSCCNSDIKYLYKSVFNNLGFDKVIFHEISKLIKEKIINSNIVYYDGKIYTFIDKNVKKEYLPKKSKILLIGNHAEDCIFINDLNYVWNIFKDSFTK